MTKSTRKENRAYVMTVFPAPGSPGHHKTASDDPAYQETNSLDSRSHCPVLAVRFNETSCCLSRKSKGEIHSMIFSVCSSVSHFFWSLRVSLTSLSVLALNVRLSIDSDMSKILLYRCSVSTALCISFALKGHFNFVTTEFVFLSGVCFLRAYV